jgi:lipopolysaccharide assembly outer membrane protein LptD (OstA)
MSLSAQEVKKDDSSLNRSKSYVHMLHTDVTRFDESINPDAWILVGDVRFRRDSMYMYCDSAHYFQKVNSFQAFGNVRMEQGDTLFLYGDYLDFDGNTNVARVRNNVRLIDKNTVFTTDSLDFDRNINLGYFFDNGTLSDDESTLKSYYGQYNVNTKEAFFKKNVALEHPDFRMVSDTLLYNTDSKIATILGPTNMYSNESEVYSERGRYNTSERLAYLLDRSVIYNDNKDVTADSIYYDVKHGYSEVFGNIVYNDTINRNMLTGDYAYLNEIVDSAFVTGRAVVTDYSQRDSLFMHADTIWAVSYNLDTDSLYRQVKAYHRVSAWGKSVQAICDSLVFDSRDSCMTMYKDPIIWNDNVQLLGETVKVYMDTASIDWVHVINQTLYAEPVDSIDYNQVKGQEMKFYFTDGKLKEMEVVGSVEVIFYPVDESDGSFVGMNTTTAGRLVAYLANGQVDKMFVPKDAKGVFYPMGQRPPEARFLSNFVWFDHLRPKSKEDIFNWVGKGSGMQLKVIRRENIPLPTLDRFKNKKK